MSSLGRSGVWGNGTAMTEKLALDIGCGDKLYQSNHPSGYDWIGIDKHDFSYLYEQGEGEFYQHDLVDPLPFGPNRFDLVWCHHVLEHLPHRHPERDIDFVIWVVNGIYDVLKMGGETHLIVPYKGHTNAWRAPHHYRYFDENTFTWWSTRENGLIAEHNSSGMIGSWRVERSQVWDDCHVYGILRKMPLDQAHQGVY